MMNRIYPENISTEELQEYDLSWYRGEIVLVDNMETFHNIMPALRDIKVFGFDTETRPAFKKVVKHKVSLLQLATDDVACLFRINKIGIPDELARLLSDPSIFSPE